MDTIHTLFNGHMDTIFVLIIVLALYLYSDWKSERNRIEQNKRIDVLYNMHIDFLQRRSSQQTFKWKE